MLTIPLRFTLAPGLDLQRVADKLPFTYTGADLYALCSDAMLKAITRAARLVDEKVSTINSDRAAQSPPLNNITIAYFFDHYAKPEDMSVIVAEEDFYAAQRELIPSVSADELGHYERVRKEFEGGKEKSEQPPAQTNGTSAPSISKEQIAEMLRMQMQRAGQDGAVPQGKPSGQNNGKGRADGTVGDEDDFVVRTDHLSINGTGHGKGKGKDKGKGKRRVEIAEGPPETFGDAAGEDEDMYA